MTEEKEALTQLRNYLYSDKFSAPQAQEMVELAIEQRGRLMREVCDLNIRLERYRCNHEALMDAVTDITERNGALRKKIIAMGGTI